MTQMITKLPEDKVSTINFNLVFDRLSICFNEPNKDTVKKTCGLLLNDYMTKYIPGMHVTKNARYEVSCKIPVEASSNGRHICFEAGPRRPGQPSFRLDFNPSKLSSDALNEFISHLAGWIDENEIAFFYFGKVTRCDVALDLIGLCLEDVIVRTTRKQKHGVYSNRHGDPETTYIGTPRTSRVVAYDKATPDGLGTCLRLETRLKPNLFGHQLAALANPFAKVKLLPAQFSAAANLGVPTQLIADSIRIGGLRRALKPFDAPRQKALKSAYEAAHSLLPDLDDLWTTWPDTLINCGLGKELGAIPIKAYMAA